MNAHRESSAWNDERVERLKAMLDDGLSARLIANALGGGLTRNSVISKIHRLGLAGTNSTPRVTAQNGRPQGARTGRTRSVPRPRVKASEARAAVSEIELALPATDDPLSPKGCRWPIGDVGAAGFRFCQHPRFTTPAGRASSWCEAHHALGHVRSA